MITYYAIQHKPSGFYLPASRRRRGFTWDEPVDPEITPPRLFLRKWDAQKALDWWLSGKTDVRHVADYEGGTDEDWNTKKVESRKPEEMGVIELFVSEINWWKND